MAGTRRFGRVSGSEGGEGGWTPVAPVGAGRTLRWVDRTGGQLTAAERRSLLRPLARTHAANAAGRLAMLVRLDSGRRRHIAPARMLPPSSVLTRAAEEQAQRRLSPALLNHSYRTFAYRAALGAWENLDVDRELLYAAALLHDIGLPTGVDNVDFTMVSARVARDVAEEVGLRVGLLQGSRPLWPARPSCSASPPFSSEPCSSARSSSRRCWASPRCSPGSRSCPSPSPSPQAPTSGRLMARTSPRAIAVVGLTGAAAGALLLSTASGRCPVRPRRAARPARAGLGVGMVFVAVSVSAMTGIPAQHAGMASGFLMTGLTSPADVVAGFSRGFVAAATVAALIAVVAFLRMPSTRATGGAHMRMH